MTGVPSFRLRAVERRYDQLRGYPPVKDPERGRDRELRPDSLTVTLIDGALHRLVVEGPLVRKSDGREGSWLKFDWSLYWPGEPDAPAWVFEILAADGLPGVRARERR